MMSRLADWMARRTRGTAGRRPTPVILMYHRVARTRHDPWALAVHPERFGRQMDWLSRHRTVLPMDEFVALMKRDRLPRTAVGLTFDDGYVDNLTAAKPVLERHNLPATVFALGDRQGAEPFWWDELADLVLACPRAKDEQFSIGPERVRLCWTVRQSEQAGEVWHADMEPREAREAAYLQIWRILQAMSPEGRSETLARLRAILPEPVGEPALRMTPAQLAKATGDGTLSMGGHGMTHSRLSDLTAPQLAAELAGSLDFCRRHGSHPSPGFAYPYGDLNGDVREAVRRSGFAWACTTREGAVDPRGDPFDLPRVAVGDWDVTRFAATVSNPDAAGGL